MFWLFYIYGLIGFNVYDENKMSPHRLSSACLEVMFIAKTIVMAMKNPLSVQTVNQKGLKRCKKF